MRKIAFALIPLLVLALVFGFIGCASSVTPTPTPTLIPTPTVALMLTPTVAPSFTPAPTSTMALFLEITQPVDGAQVSTSAVLVTGKTIKDAVVSASADDVVEIANVDQNGNFSVTVNLEEGPNIIEVIASDQQGNEKSSNIAVIYLP
jgi:Glucodextranase, domain B